MRKTSQETSLVTADIFRHCGSCKKPIAYASVYYACGIASCKKSIYCSMPCFDDHIAVMRHKDAWAEEHVAPKEAPASRISTARLVEKKESQSQTMPHDVLVVASKLKDYIRAKSGLNTSASVLERLSDMIRLQCDRAVERAVADGRKTVMDKDF